MTVGLRSVCHHFLIPRHVLSTFMSLQVYFHSNDLTLITAWKEGNESKNDYNSKALYLVS